MSLFRSKRVPPGLRSIDKRHPQCIVYDMVAYVSFGIVIWIKTLLKVLSSLVISKPGNDAYARPQSLIWKEAKGDHIFWQGCGVPGCYIPCILISGVRDECASGRNTGINRAYPLYPFHLMVLPCLKHVVKLLTSLQHSLEGEQPEPLER